MDILMGGGNLSKVDLVGAKIHIFFVDIINEWPLEKINCDTNTIDAAQFN